MDALVGLALVSALAAGALGGVHCAGMCGGLVGVCAMGSGRPAPALLVTANLGRVASYTLAGALAGALGQAGLWLRGGVMLQQVMFLVASLMLIVLGLYLAGYAPVLRRLEAAGTVVWRRVEPGLKWVLPVNSLPRAAAFGALWGWLPCGLVYAMLATALAMGTPLTGAAVMLAFGIGTLPNLLLLGWLAGRTPRFAAPVRLVAGLAVVGFGVFGLYKMTQPATFGEDGLLCHAWPAFLDWFRQP